MATMLHADGTVRLASEGDEKSNAALVQLARALEEFKLPSSRIWVARELVAMQRELDGEERRAAIMLVLLVMVAQQEGSTRIPTNTAFLEERIELLLGLVETTARESDRTPVFGASDAPRWAQKIQALLEGRLDALVGAPQDYKPLICDGVMLYTDQSWQQEESVSRHLREFIGGAGSLHRDACVQAVEDVLEVMAFEMETDELHRKREQVLKVLDDRLGIISGGPGTGKTTLVLTVLRVLVRQEGIAPGDLLLAAPTGKAAKRMRESIDEQFGLLEERLAKRGGSLADADRRLRAELPDPVTLHRLLRYSPYRRGFRHNADDPVVAKYVVVDEASMIDLRLMDALLEGLSDETRLLLIGDADQLPAVGSGAVFRHLSPTDESPTDEEDALELPGAVRLTVTHRSVPEIEKVARDINAGSFDCERSLSAGDIWSATSLAGLSDEARVGLVEPSETSGVGAFVDAWFAARVDLTTCDYNPAGRGQADYECLEKLGDMHVHRSQRIFIQDDEGRFVGDCADVLDELFGFYESSRILCATRSQPTGSNSINRQMHRLFRDKHGLQDSARFRAGEPVMVVRNDYDHELFNGDQGVVLYTTRPEEREGSANNAKKRVVFRDGDRFRTVALGHIKDRLELSYAMTVHKSQGSEYKHVALVLPDDAASPLLTREVVYTGLTRAKDSVTIFGRRDILQKAASRKMHRFSGIREKVAND